MPELIACLDAAYSASAASAACVLSASWAAPAPERTLIIRRNGPSAAYEPGSFYKRELPLLLGVLDQVTPLPGVVIVDGYVWLDGERRPGLGARLYEALGERIPVVGVAKTSFADASFWCIPVLRGVSRKPLFVSAAGMDGRQAAECVRSMHGAHRIPTLLQCADDAARAALG